MDGPAAAQLIVPDVSSIGAALDVRRAETGRKVCQEGFAHLVPPGGAGHLT